MRGPCAPAREVCPSAPPARGCVAGRLFRMPWAVAINAPTFDFRVSSSACLPFSWAMRAMTRARGPLSSERALRGAVRHVADLLLLQAQGAQFLQLRVYRRVMCVAFCCSSPRKGRAIWALSVSARNWSVKCSFWRAPGFSIGRWPTACWAAKASKTRLVSTPDAGPAPIGALLQRQPERQRRQFELAGLPAQLRSRRTQPRSS